jgi:hypothetical protein
VLFYGSCRRTGDDAGGIVDLYVLVDDYRAAYRRRGPALANRLLAPNVYYLEVAFAGRTARAKCAVVSLAQFERGTARWFHPYLWGRFAQPCALLYAADERVRARVIAALANAAITFARRVLPRLPEEFDAAAFWSQGLLLSYATELRSEPAAKIRALATQSADELDARARILADVGGWPRIGDGCYRNPSGARARWSGALAWSVRRVQGKLLSVLRLLKASFTFAGGIAYVAWKIERHTGVHIEITPSMRRWPRVGAIGALWRAWRQGGFH